MNKKEARKELGMNNTELAQFLGISEKHLRNLKELNDTHIRLLKGEIVRRDLWIAIDWIESLYQNTEEHLRRIDKIKTALERLDNV